MNFGTYHIQVGRDSINRLKYRYYLSNMITNVKLNHDDSLMMSYGLVNKSREAIQPARENGIVDWL
jgi:hypothetical protein